MKTKKLLLSLTGLLVLNHAQALPTIYPTSQTYLSSITNSTNSNLVADDTDKRVIYVMPPNSATSTVAGLHTISANIGFCKEMADIQKFSRSTVQKMNDLANEELESRQNVENLRTKISTARAEMSASATVGKLEEILNLDSRLNTIESRLSELNVSLSECTQFCQNIRSEMQELRAEKIEVSKARRVLASAHTKELIQYEKKKAVVAALQSDLIELQDAWGELSARLTKIRKNFHEMYSSFGGMEGARAGILFKSNWDQNIDQLRQENTNFDFKKINTQNAVITTSIANLNSMPSGGAILGYEIGGTVTDGKLTMPSYPENMSGNVRLSLLGACPVLHPDYFDINLPNSTDQMLYGMTVSYEYPTAFLAEATANYNMYKMYSKIASSGTSGGFFRSRSWSSIEERTYFRDSFTVKWTEQDSANSISDEQKADLEREMRNNVFARLAAIGLPAVSNAGALVAPPALSKTGAVVISESLMKSCPGNAYCIGAAITMDVLQAIFGSSSSSASYSNIQDANLEEKWSRSKVIYKPWISSYN